MKLYALINWAGGTPKITTLNMTAIASMDRTIVEKTLEKIKDQLAKNIRFEIVEFISNKEEIVWPE